MYGFLWNKSERIKRCTLTAPYINGGLNVTDIESFLEGLQATWINRLFGNNDQCSWKCIPTYYFNTIAPWNVLQFSNFISTKQFPFLKNLPPFYQQVLIAYNKSKNVSPIVTHDDLINQPIFGNRFLMTKSSKNTTTLLFPNWINYNITHINHLAFADGKIEIDYLYNKILNHTNLHIEARKLMQALTPYRHLILNVRDTNTVPIAPQIPLKSKQFYNNLSKRKHKYATLSKWSYLIPDFNNEIHTTSAFLNKCVKIQETKLAEFNFKLLHYILPCNKHLKTWGKKTSDLCALCGGVESIEHLIYHCPFVREIWKKIESNLPTEITLRKIVFGIENNNVINTLISQITFSIFKSWVQCENDTSQNRTGDHIIRTIKNDLCFKLLVWKTIQKQEIADLFTLIANGF